MANLLIQLSREFLWVLELENCQYRRLLILNEWMNNVRPSFSVYFKRYVSSEAIFLKS
jgi:hypothetical protein